MIASLFGLWPKQKNCLVAARCWVYEMLKGMCEGRQNWEKDSHTPPTSLAVKFNDSNVSLLRPSSGDLSPPSVWNCSIKRSSVSDGIRSSSSTTVGDIGLEKRAVDHLDWGLKCSVNTPLVIHPGSRESSAPRQNKFTQPHSDKTYSRGRTCTVT